MYNKYIDNNCSYTRAVPDTASNSKNTASGGIFKAFDFNSLFGGLLPDGIDSGDIFLLLILLFLYIETDDNDFLIILAVIAFSIIKGE